MSLLPWVQPLSEQVPVSQLPEENDSHRRKRTLLVTSIIVIGLVASLVLTEYYTQDIASPHPPSGIEPTTLTSQAIVPATTVLSLLPNISGYNLSYIGADMAATNQIGADAVLLYNYAATNSTTGRSYEAVIEIGGRNLTTPSETLASHASLNATNLFPIFVNTSVVVLQRSVLSLFRPSVEGRFIVFQNSAGPQSFNESILYWIVSAPSLFRIQGSSQPREVIIWIISTTSNAQTSALESSSLSLSRSIANYWAPVSNPMAIH